MTQVLYLSFVLLLFVLGSIKDMKIDKYVAVLACVYLVTLMGGQTTNQDYYIYKNIFNGDFYIKDPGFGLIIEVLKKFGFSEETFRLGIAVIGFLLISVTVFRLVNNRTLFYIVYAIYPFLFDVVQARNFLAMAILVFSIPFLIKGDIKGKIIFIILILCAATIQKISLVYIPLAFVNGIRESKHSRWFFRIIIVTSVLVGLSRSTLLGFVNSIIIPITGRIDELSSYARVNTNMGWIIFWTEQILAYMLIKIATNIDNKFIDQVSPSDDIFSPAKFQNRFVNLMCDINYYMFIFLPLFILDENYTRIIRNILPLNIIAYIIVLTKHNKRVAMTIKRCGLLVGVLLYQIIMYLLLYRTYADTIVKTTFFENWIWK